MPSFVEYINPEGTAPAQGLYSHIGRAAAGNLMFIAGQLSVNQAGEIIGANDFEAQYRQVFSNMRDVLDGVGLAFRNVAKFTTIFTRAQDIELFMRLRAESFPAMFGGDVFPPNTILVVSRLVKPEFLLEVEAIAATA
jgi:enamine deaminase RidA (YjgF/YER057c/UK114 family)